MWRGDPLYGDPWANAVLGVDGLSDVRGIWVFWENLMGMGYVCARRSIGYEWGWRMDSEGMLGEVGESCYFLLEVVGWVARWMYEWCCSLGSVELMDSKGMLGEVR